MHNDSVLDIRAQNVARLSINAAQMNSYPDDTKPIVEAFERVLEIAAAAPGGQMALLDELLKCNSHAEILAFCKLFASMAIAHAAMYDTEAQGSVAHDEPVPN